MSHLASYFGQAVRDLFAGTEPKNVGALQDPTAFDEYRKMAKDGL